MTLELGGKSPYVVVPDADIEKAAETAATGIFYNTGRSCDGCSRALVHEEGHDEFVEAFLDAVADWESGDPLVEGTTMGPLTFDDQYEKVSKYCPVVPSERRR